jgi:hypothetical protein
VGWLLIAVFRDRILAMRERHRTRVAGFGAMSFRTRRDGAATRNGES